MTPFERGFKDNERARDERKHVTSQHTEDLFDEGQDFTGEKIDLATGKPFEHKHLEPADSKMSVVEPGDRDALPPLEHEDDAAAKWLRENGG
jgi:hypothetical protein